MEKTISDTNLQTLEIIAAHPNTKASILASDLGIAQSAFSNRVRKIDESFLNVTPRGKERLYSLTDAGKQFLENNKSRKENTKNISNSKLILNLEMLLGKTFDGTYLLVDIFFKAPLCSVIKNYMNETLDIDPQNPLIMEVYRDLFLIFYTSITKKHTKEQFFAELVSTNICSHEMRGLLHYIADKYDEVKKDLLSSDKV